MNCGVIGYDDKYNEGGFKIHEFGIRGRICPYMLKPVPNTTNINNLFKGCKSLGYYVDEFKRAYTIPKDFFKYAKNINSLVGTFSEMLFPNNVDVKLFDHLTSTLNISEIFCESYWSGTENSKTTLSEIFRNNDVSHTYRAFCPYKNWASSTTAYPVGQYITFDKIFKSKYSNSSYANESNYSETFAGYRKEYVTHESEKTLPDNASTNNYTYFGNIR
jgi:hypothetical protein